MAENVWQNKLESLLKKKEEQKKKRLELQCSIQGQASKLETSYNTLLLKVSASSQ